MFTTLLESKLITFQEQKEAIHSIGRYVGMEQYRREEQQKRREYYQKRKLENKIKKQ